MKNPKRNRVHAKPVVSLVILFECIICSPTKKFNRKEMIKPKYAERVLNFNKDIISEAPYLLITKEEFKISIEQEEKFLQQMFEDIGELAIIAEFQGEVIGFLDFYNGYRNRIKHQGSFGMSVSKQFRNQGIGSALLTELQNWANQETSIEKVCLEVVSINKSAIQMYEKFWIYCQGQKIKSYKK